jgi:general stress protein 26
VEKEMIPSELKAMFEEITTPVIFATVDRYPHATPMNWLWLEDEGVFWFNPAGGTKKIELMKKNGNVCFGTIDGMKKEKRGFIVWGEIVKFEYGFWALGRNAFVKKKMLVKKSQICFDIRILKFWRAYSKHPDIHYSTLPWKAAFVRVKPKRIMYWNDDQVEKEIYLE